MSVTVDCGHCGAGMRPSGTAWWCPRCGSLYDGQTLSVPVVIAAMREDGKG